MSWFLRNHLVFVVLTENAQMGWQWFRGAQSGLLHGMWPCLARLSTPTWKMQPSWRHLTRWPSMLDSHHRLNLSRSWRSPTAQSTVTFFSYWKSWAAGDWWRWPGMFEHFRFFFQRISVAGCGVRINRQECQLLTMASASSCVASWPHCSLRKQCLMLRFENRRHSIYFKIVPLLHIS